MKLVRETHKILNDASIGVTATAVRIPVVGGHSEAVNIEFRNPYEVEDVREILDQTEGVIVQDDINNNQYPMPFYAEGKDEVFVGRIRRDLSRENTLNMWIVADNLRKGAATNTIQIAEYLMANNLVGKALGRAVTWTGVGSIDKSFGLLFGIFKGYVVSVCIF